MKNVLRSMLVLLLLSLSPGQANAEEFVLYDDFEPESGLIDPLKWMGEEGNEGRILRESVRKLTNKALKMKVIVYNNTDPNAVYGLGTNSLIHTNGEAVNDIKVSLKVDEFIVNRCSSVNYVWRTYDSPVKRMTSGYSSLSSCREFSCTIEQIYRPLHFFGKCQF